MARTAFSRREFVEDLWSCWQAAVTNASREHPLDKLLGYPSVSSLGYDPTPGPRWLPLLTLASHDDLEWCWHDGDYLFVFIEHDRLAAHDFSALQCDAG